VYFIYSAGDSPDEYYSNDEILAQLIKEVEISDLSAVIATRLRYTVYIQAVIGGLEMLRQGLSIESKSASSFLDNLPSVFLSKTFRTASL